MPTNVHPEYIAAEKKFHAARTDDERLEALEEMMRTMPKHKSGEALRKNIRTRYKKLKQKLTAKKKKAAGKKGIKKEEMQAAIIGLTNSGKSSLLTALTNARPEIASYQYTTKSPIIGTLNYQDTKIQIIDMPSIENEACNLGIINTADVLLIVIDKIQDIENIQPFLEKASEKRIIIFNKTDLLDENEKRKISATLQSKKYNFFLFSCKTKTNLQELKEKIFLCFGKIRIYTKQPGKPPDNNPVILQEGSTVKDIAEKIFHGLSSQIKETRITGPSSKFPNQKVGLSHELKDKDIVEFYTK